MILTIFSYIFLTGVVAVFVSALGEADLALVRKQFVKRWATYLVIGAFLLLWLSIAQEPLILP